MADDLLEAEIDRLGVALIELHGVALPASLSHCLHHGTGTSSLAYIGNGDIPAGGSKSLGNRSADVAGASGHEGNLSIEIHGFPL